MTARLKQHPWAGRKLVPLNEAVGFELEYDGTDEIPRVLGDLVALLHEKGVLSDQEALRFAGARYEGFADD